MRDGVAMAIKKLNKPWKENKHGRKTYSAKCLEL